MAGQQTQASISAALKKKKSRTLKLEQLQNPTIAWDELRLDTPPDNFQSEAYLDIALRNWLLDPGAAKPGNQVGDGIPGRVSSKES